MRCSSVSYKLLVVALLAFTSQSCKKTNGIDNNQVITKPYTLYVVDSSGVVFNTNDGKTFRRASLTADGIPTASLITSGKSILFIKDTKSNIFMSDDEGDNFNPVYNPLSAAAFGQNMMINLHKFGIVDDRIYATTGGGTGVVYNDSNGKKTAWKTDNSAVLTGANVTSYTRLQGGLLIAFDDVNRFVFTKTDDGSPWVKKAAIGLPAAGSGQFFVSHFGDKAIAVDRAATEGVYFSNDAGDTWTKYVYDFPSGTIINHAYAPFEQVLLVSTNYGMYRLSRASNTFETSNFGLDDSTRIYGITGKNDFYKNDATKEYVYIATSTGIYRSEDLGDNWTKVFAGIGQYEDASKFNVIY